MSGTLGIVYVRPRMPGQGSTARIGSLAGRRLGDKSLLEWVVRRVTDAQRLDGVMVVLADEREERHIAGLVPPDVPVLISNKPDPLGRIAHALGKFSARGVVCMGVENPFIDPVLIDRAATVAEANPECDFVGCRSRDGNPDAPGRLGFFAHWCSVEALCRADRKTTDPIDRTEVTRYVYSRPEKFHLHWIPVPEPLDQADLRLTIRHEEDWDHAQTIFDALGPEGLDWQGIVGLLDRQPSMRKKMSVLNRAEASA